MKRTQKTERVSVVRFSNCARIDVAKDLHAVADYLKERGIEQVALELTGVHWIPVYEVLDGEGFDMWLVNSVGLARPDRRKSDVLDCQWLRQLTTLDLLHKSYRPEDASCAAMFATGSG